MHVNWKDIGRSYCTCIQKYKCSKTFRQIECWCSSVLNLLYVFTCKYNGLRQSQSICVYSSFVDLNRCKKLRRMTGASDPTRSFRATRRTTPIPYMCHWEKTLENIWHSNMVRKNTPLARPWLRRTDFLSSSVWQLLALPDVTPRARNPAPITRAA